jgi:hypothetical protein
MVGGGGDCSPTLELWYAAASSPVLSLHLYTLYLGTEFSFGEFTFEHVLIIHSAQFMNSHLYTCPIRYVQFVNSHL